MVSLHNTNSLINSCLNGEFDGVKYLIERGVNVHDNNDAAIRWASLRGHIDIVKYLVSVGANIHANDDEAVIWASKEGRLEVVKYLVIIGANVHYAIKYAIKYYKHNVVRYLLSLGVPDPRIE